MDLPSSLLSDIKKGRVLLFLGSGALYGAKLKSGPVPLGNDLRDKLADDFLGGKYKEGSLAHVAALAQSQTSLFDVQDSIKEQFEDLVPNDFHLKLPKFKWRAIFTTNYDRLVEICYEKGKDNIQNLSVILSDSDKLDETRITENKLPLIKLHGCITRSRDMSIPLILTIEQYNDYLDNRKRLFQHLYELAYEYTIVFVGHSLLDADIRQVLGDLRKEAPNGNRHYLLKPGVESIEKDYWADKKISALDFTFESFLNAIDSNITTQDIAISNLIPNSEHPIQAKFISKISLSETLDDFLKNNVEFVYENMPFKSYSAKEFFKGADQGWYPVSEGIPIHRSLQEKIIQGVIEKADAERTSPTDFYVIKGEAGSGKTILLRQLAWNVKDFSYGLVLWVRSNCSVDADQIADLIEATGERVFLFWDDCAVNSIEMYRFISKSKKKKLKVTLIASERYNEWNTKCDELDELLSSSFSLRYLSETEIDKLVLKLTKYDSLGPNLIHKSHKERCSEFKDIHGRQLLVALHESTMGEPFEDIVFNEYENIEPAAAKSIYKTVCTLNRLRIPIRAGLISRIHDISFQQFQEVFYKPLERVVIVQKQGTGDIHYTARHSEIAEIVFRRALSNAEDRYHEYISIISKLNISFETDKNSFRNLIKARSLHELFPSFEDVLAIYRFAEKNLGSDPYLLQQRANYERLRPNGSLDAAIKLLESAKDLAPYDSSIIHTLSVVWRDKAKNSSDAHQRKKCRGEARAYLESSSTKWGLNSITACSLIELSIANLKDNLEDEYTTEAVIRDSIRNIQQSIIACKQKFPEDGGIFKLESIFSEVIGEDDDSIAALERSFELNDREPYLAMKLSDLYRKKGDYSLAKEILGKALERRRSDHHLNFHYAELLRTVGGGSYEDLIYYYRRSFSPKDKNFQAQFWFARYGYNSLEDNIRNLALEIFESLRNVRMSTASKNKIQDIEKRNGLNVKQKGVLVRKSSDFGFISMDGAGHDVFVSEYDIEDDLWEVMSIGDRLDFELGYCYNGLRACKVTE